MKKTWEDFVKWLESLPPDRAFKNGSASECVGHCFCYEYCHDYKSFHLVCEVDEILPGFTDFFFDLAERCPHTGDGEHHAAAEILKMAKEFKQ